MPTSRHESDMAWLTILSLNTSNLIASNACVFPDLLFVALNVVCSFK
jgi:hypothetical protein